MCQDEGPNLPRTWRWRRTKRTGSIKSLFLQMLVRLVESFLMLKTTAKEINRGWRHPLLALWHAQIAAIQSVEKLLPSPKHMADRATHPQRDSSPLLPCVLFLFPAYIFKLCNQVLEKNSKGDKNYSVPCTVLSKSIMSEWWYRCTSQELEGIVLVCTLTFSMHGRINMYITPPYIMMRNYLVKTWMLS